MFHFLFNECICFCLFLFFFVVAASDKKTQWKLHLKRKHRVDPLNGEDTPTESPAPPPPPGQSELPDWWVC